MNTAWDGDENSIEISNLMPQDVLVCLVTVVYQAVHPRSVWSGCLFVSWYFLTVSHLRGILSVHCNAWERIETCQEERGLERLDGNIFSFFEWEARMREKMREKKSRRNGSCSSSKTRGQEERSVWLDVLSFKGFERRLFSLSSSLPESGSLLLYSYSLRDSLYEGISFLYILYILYNKTVVSF